MSPPTFDLYFTGSRGNPRQCIIIGEGVHPVFFRFETPQDFITNANARTTIYRNQNEIAATFDWHAVNYLGHATVPPRGTFPMLNLAFQSPNHPNTRAFFLNNNQFEWRRRPDDPFSYDLFAPQNVQIGLFRRVDQPTPIGPSHGFMQYMFQDPALLLEALLALCVNRWIDSQGLNNG